MAQAPIMPVFTDALIADTTHLSPEEFGCYVRLLIATWRNNGKALADDDKHLAQVCGLGVQKWRAKIRPEVAKFFDITGTGWHQKRLEAEWDRVSGIVAKRRASASAGGKAAAESNRARLRKAEGAATHHHKEVTESLCVDSETPSRAPAHTRARKDTKNQGMNGLNGEDWHDQYIDIGRKAAFDVERL